MGTLVDVLLIEDSLPEAHLIETIAAQSSAPIRITIAHDCSGALTRLSDVQLRPRLVIADLGALEFRGIELLKRCNPQGIPVVIFTGSQNPADAALALRLGPKEFIFKPTELDQYTEAVSTMISKWAAPEA